MDPRSGVYFFDQYVGFKPDVRLRYAFERRGLIDEEARRRVSFWPDNMNDFRNK